MEGKGEEWFNYEILNLIKEKVNYGMLEGEVKQTVKNTNYYARNSKDQSKGP